MLQQHHRQLTAAAVLLAMVALLMAAQTTSAATATAATAGLASAATAAQPLVVPPVAQASLPASCRDGTYETPDGPFAPGCPGYAKCEPGFWCADGLRRACDVGHYGDRPGQTSSSCSGKCDAGYFCVQTFNHGLQLWQGSITATQNKCGGAGVFCPAGSSDPSPVSKGYYTVGPSMQADANATRAGERRCEVGHYCTGGIKYQCPGGRYGATRGLSSPQCSGECAEGYYCPSGSISATQISCLQGEGLICPAGSAAPQPILQGQFTDTGGVGGHYTTQAADQLSRSDPAAGPISQSACPLGHYCSGGRKIPCPEGRYGSTTGMTDSACSGICEAGYYCPPGSVSPRERRCGNNTVFCTPGSSQPTPVSDGYSSIGGEETTRTGQKLCPAGSYCVAGQRFQCARGRYGATRGETKPGCSGPCFAGYYCDAGSTDPQQHECGNSEVYCPEGSHEPLDVYVGYYTIRVLPGTSVETTTDDEFSHPQSLTQFQPDALNEYPPDTTGSGGASAVASTILTEIRLDTTAIRTDERQCQEGHYCIGGERFACPAGRYGASRKLSSDLCSGNCTKGYYCPAGSTRPDQVPCGSNSVYCPPASVEPTPVSAGYYTINGTPYTRDAQTICVPGTWCEGGVWTYCGAGSYGATSGLTTPTCSGVCDAGYYCPTGSTSTVQVPCGDETVYCPRGSAKPLPVDEGFYTAGGRNTGIAPTAGMFCRATYGELDNAAALVAPIDVAFDPRRYCTGAQIGDNATRSTQVACEIGHFCVNGLRYECPPAHYGSAPSLSNPKCTGRCAPGWYCPWASTSPFQLKCGGPHVYCPVLSGSPTPVSTGFYTKVDRASDIRTEQSICEPGWYCVGGQRYPCPARRYGSTPGLTNALCSGVCAAGFACEEASVSATVKECGNAGVYCPVGSRVGLPAAQGFYTTGGWEQQLGKPENTTRDWQQICEPGHYCEGGIKRQCPAAVYGLVSGLYTPECSGVCPEGYFCPPGTVEPLSHTCGSVFLNSSDASYMDDGNAINGGFFGAGAVADTAAEDNPLFIAWEDGVRVRRPTVDEQIESIVSIHSFHLQGGASSVYCPEGSAFPLPVTSGYYSIGGSSDNTTRSAQLPCEAGWYCVAGRKYPCPAGTFGNVRKLTSRYCSGWCPAGFYCPLAAPKPLPCPYNTYSTGGSPVCLTCPTEQLVGEVERCRDSRLCCNY